jgi:NhaP-type Na+/H+ or K+/H+ antiporter
MLSVTNNNPIMKELLNLILVIGGGIMVGMLLGVILGVIREWVLGLI